MGETMKTSFWLALLSMALLLTSEAAIATTSRYGLNFCADANFKCIRIRGGQSWESLFPNEYQRQVVKRLNRMNIRLHNGMVIAVPQDLANTDLLDISPFPSKIDPPGEKMIVVDPPSLAWGAYDSAGNLVHWGPISGGKSYCPDVQRNCRTVDGNFRIYHKKGADCISKKFPVGSGGAPMPYCMYFHGGFALHASTTVPGYHASHGCVRIFAEDAQWLNQDFVNLPGDEQKGTAVIVNPYL